MANEKATTDGRFRSMLEVKRAYLPALLKSQSAEDVPELIERTAEITEHTLRKHVKKQGMP